MIDQVVTVRPPGNNFTKCFEPVARAFAAVLRVPEENCWAEIPERSLVIGAHLITTAAPKNCVIWNSENLFSGWFSAHYKQLMEGNTVWEYDRANLEKWEESGIAAKWVPLGWHESMREEWEPDLVGPVMHYGSINKRRSDILDATRTQRFFGIFGDKLRHYLRMHGAVANIHYHMPGMFEIVRCSQLFANGMPVLSEECADGHWESVLPDGTFCPYDQLADRIRARDYPSGDEQRKAYEKFKMADVLENL